MDMYKKVRKFFWIGLIFLILLICIIAIMQNKPVKLEGAWEINDDGEIIVFYDNDICVCDGDEMIYRIIDNNTISLDGEIYEFEITDKKNKKMILDEKD